MLAETQINELADKAETSLHKLSEIVLTGLKPPPGPYAFFHYSVHAITRLHDCRRITQRLFSGRRKLNELAKQANSIKRGKISTGKSQQDELKIIREKDRETTTYMKFDLESLYMFGTILLDQWALQTICIGNLSIAKRHPFVSLVGYFDAGNKSILDPIWDQLKEKILWLHYQIRFYRNKFVVHANRPWERGTTRSVFGDDFNLFIPTPPGWINDERANQEIIELIHLAPEYIQKAGDDCWEKKRPKRLIEVLFNRIGNIEQKKNRERVASLFSKVGGSTPTFQIIVNNLFEFVLLGTSLLCDIAEKNIDNIDLGNPFRNSKQMMNELNSRYKR